MRVSIDSKKFKKEMDNLMKYSIGFLDGVQVGKQEFFRAIGSEAVEMLKEFIDSNARVNPEALHHVYEWMQTGSPNARLFDIDYSVNGRGLSVGSTFTQSSSVKQGSTTPFYDKARIMEEGIPVTIRPVKANVLSFTNSSGEQVFTPGPVEVGNPGGSEVEGSYQRIFDTFFDLYFRQSFLMASGIMEYLERPTLFKTSFASGKAGGRQKGVATGYRWIVNAGKGGL